MNKLTEKSAECFDDHDRVRGSNLRRVIWLLLVLLVLAAVGLVMWQLGQRPVRQIEVLSDGQAVSVAEVQALVQHDVKRGFFKFSASRLQHHLQLLPWVATVSVRRIWPDRLRVYVHEQQAAAIWNETQLLTAKANLFQPSLVTFPDNLPRLSGGETQEQKVWQQFQYLQDFFKPLGCHVVAVALKGHHWQVPLSAGTIIRLSEGTEVAELKRFKKLYRGPLHRCTTHITHIHCFNLPHP